MLARDLAEQVPLVTRATTGAEAARVVAEYRLSALVVADDAGLPETVISGSQLLGLVLPTYLKEEPGLAHALDDPAADRMCARLNDHTIGDLLAEQRIESRTPARVKPEDNLIEIASVMVAGNHPMVLCVENDGRYVGCLTTSRVLAAIAIAAGQDSPLIQYRMSTDIADRAGLFDQEDEP